MHRARPGPPHGRSTEKRADIYSYGRYANDQRGKEADYIFDRVESEAKAWFQRVIEEVRAGEARFDPEDLRTVRGIRLLDFGPPCQVRAFHIREPTAFFTLITRVPGGPDGDVRVSRPLHLWQLYDDLERVAGEPLWDAPLPPTHRARLQPGEEPTFRPVVEQALAHAYQHARQLPFVRPHEDSHGMMSSLAGEGASWWLASDVTKLNPLQFAAGIVRELGQEIEAQTERRREAAARSSKPGVRPSRTARAPRDAYPGWGVWWYPRIRIGPRPRTALWERMHSNPFDVGDVEVRASTEVAAGRRAVATHHGFIGIIRDSDPASVEDRGDIEDWLNALAYCFSERGVDSFTVLAAELAGFEWSERDGGRYISKRMMPHTYRTTSSPIEDMFPGDIPLVNASEFTAIARAASAVIDSERLRHARLVVEAKTHLRRGHPTESFFFSWLLLEQLVNEDWESYVVRDGFSRRRRNRLADTQQWNVEAKLEVLELAGALQLDYTEVMKLKKPRNQIIHGTRAATRDEASSAIALAASTLRERLGLNLPYLE